MPFVGYDMTGCDMWATKYLIYEPLARYKEISIYFYMTRLPARGNSLYALYVNLFSFKDFMEEFKCIQQFFTYHLWLQIVINLN